MGACCGTATYDFDANVESHGGRHSRTSKMRFFFDYSTCMHPDFIALYNVKPLSSRRAVLKNYQFNISVFTNYAPNPCQANIVSLEENQFDMEYRSDDVFHNEVHGTLYELSASDLEIMCNLNYEYRAQKVWVESYDNADEFAAVALVFDKDMQDKAMKDMQVIHRTLYKDDEKCSQNYSSRVLNGAKKIGLNEGYIEYLEKMMTGCVVFEVEAPSQQKFLEVTRQRDFNFDEVKNSLNKQSFLCVLKGVVIEYPSLGKILNKRLAGRDITLDVAKEWANANVENCESVHSLEDGQKAYVNCVLHNLFAGGLPIVSIVGKLEQEDEHSMESFEW